MFPAKPYSPPEVRKGRRFLPHWNQDGVAYSAGWRLGDSLPQSILEPWRRRRRDWLEIHPPPWDEETEDEYHELFTDQMEHWLDQGMGSCLLRAGDLRAVVEASLSPRLGARHVPFAFVVMPNHVHLLATIGDDETIGGVIGKLKSWTTRELNRLRGTAGPVWMEDYYDRIIRSERHFHKCISYIEQNPPKARLKPQEFALRVEPELAEERKKWRQT